MARQKLSEYRAKSMLLSDLGVNYAGVAVDATQSVDEQLSQLPDDAKYVVKVDQAIKKRMKQGLVRLDRSKHELANDISEMAGQGFRYFLVEPFYQHEAGQERYVALEHGRDGTMISFANQGGIEIEEQAESVQCLSATPENLQQAAQSLGVPADFLSKVSQAFDAAYGCFLEINPLVAGEQPQMLDVAAEVDGEAGHLAHKYWTSDDFRIYRKRTPEEVAIAELAATSRASLRYEVINPEGAVFLLLSGGGASIVVADEVNNRGFGQQLGNYGEYSGNPSEAETHAYAHQLLTTLLHSPAPRKVLVIAGAVANFTDVRATFKGIIKAFDELASELQQQGVKVFVRRGGPHQAEGLELMRQCLEKHGLLGEVHGPELPLADSVSAALAQLGEA